LLAMSTAEIATSEKTNAASLVIDLISSLLLTGHEQSQGAP
jgi:hypothetical protein